MGDPGPKVAYPAYKCQGCFSLLEVLIQDMVAVPLAPEDESAENSTADDDCVDSDGESSNGSELNGIAPDKPEQNGQFQNGHAGEERNGFARNGDIDWSSATDEDILGEANSDYDNSAPKRSYARAAARSIAKKVVFTCCLCQNRCRAHDKFLDDVEKHHKFAERRKHYQQKLQKRAQQGDKKSQKRAPETRKK